MYNKSITEKEVEALFTITAYTVERIKDPFGILSGKRYEFRLELDVPEDDELYSEHGNVLRVIFLVQDDRQQIVKYEFLESSTNRYLDFELEQEEEEAVRAFCEAHYSEAEE